MSVECICGCLQQCTTSSLPARPLLRIPTADSGIDILLRVHAEEYLSVGDFRCAVPKSLLIRRFYWDSRYLDVLVVLLG